MITIRNDSFFLMVIDRLGGGVVGFGVSAQLLKGGGGGGYKVVQAASVGTKVFRHAVRPQRTEFMTSQREEFQEVSKASSVLVQMLTPECLILEIQSEIRNLLVADFRYPCLATPHHY